VVPGRVKITFTLDVTPVCRNDLAADGFVLERLTRLGKGKHAIVAERGDLAGKLVSQNDRERSRLAGWCCPRRHPGEFGRGDGRGMDTDQHLAISRTGLRRLLIDERLGSATSV